MKILSGVAEGQVLQRLGSRGANAILRGACSENGSIRATVSKGSAALKGWKKRIVGNVARGKFEIKLESIPVGGPYTLRLETGAHHVEVKSIFVGDVWIMAGQSNMQGIGNMTAPAKPHPLIRNFSMRLEWRLAEDPLHLIAESPDSCHAPKQCSVREGEKLRCVAIKGVGAGIFFARDMMKRSGGVPQGLISTAHGGTSMQQWDPAKKKLKGASLYWSMLEAVRVTGQPVAGLLWYQGESDASPVDAAKYISRMKKLVASSRRDLAQPKLPWIIVQIGRFFRDGINAEGWDSIRELQRQLPEKIKYFETVPAIDLSMDDAIHIGSKGFPPLAARLASAADRLVYGNKQELRGPQIRSAKIVDKPTRPAAAGMEIVFDHVEGGLRATGEPSGFSITRSGEPVNIVFKTTLHGNKVLLHLDQRLGVGVDLYYGHGITPSCNITDARGFSPLAFGPYPLGDHKPKAFLPYITKWAYTGVISPGTKLDRYAISAVKALPAKQKDYEPGAMAIGLVNEHPDWEAKSGVAFFRSTIRLGEPMKLEMLMGYDGPFRLWVAGKPLFVNMQGINPCYPDESSKIIALKAGTHQVVVGMDLNEGRAWGFFLRLARRDVTKEQAVSGKFAKPVYL